MTRKIEIPFAWQKGTVVTLCIVFFMLTGCEKGDDHILLTVYDTPNYTVQAGKTTGDIEITTFMVVAEEGSDAEQNLNLSAIERFTYEKGYEYLLKVKKTFNNDDYQYSLIEIVSKTRMSEETIVLLDVTTEWLPWEPPVEKMIVNEVDSPSPSNAPSSFVIDGFEYETGFDYRIKVKKTVINTPVITGYGIVYLYEFIEIISKTPQNQ